MPSEHLIRLRGAWDYETPREGADVRRRIALPTGWPAGQPWPVRLTRRFGRPPLDPDRETVSLRMEAVAGLRRAWLNDRLVAEPPAGQAEMTVALDEPLRARNVLVLEVDAAGWAQAGAAIEPWGVIALVIRPR